MAIYIEYKGIKGNVTADGYADHISAISLHFGVSRTVSMEPGSMSNRESSRPQLDEIEITKRVDSSAAALFKESVTGSAGKQVIIKFVRTGTEKVEEFMDYTLEDCIVSGYEISASADDEPMETITLSYSSIMVNYKDHDKSNTAGSPQRVGYDLDKAKLL